MEIKTFKYRGSREILNYKGAVERGKGREGKCFGDIRRQNLLIRRN